MRLLHYAPNYLPATRYGGPIRSSHGLARALVELGHEVDVVTTNVDGPGVIDVRPGEPVMIDGVRVRYFEIATPRRIYYTPAMGRVMEAEAARFDAVHINGVYLWPGPKAARAAERNGVPFVISPRGMLVPEMIAGKSALVKRTWIDLFERRSLAAAAAIHVTSDSEADGVRRLGLDLAPMAVIGNGVEAARKRPDDGAIDAVWGRIPRGQRVAFLGRLDWTKGVELAIEAVADQPAARLLIGGHDQIGLRSELEQRIPVRSGVPCAEFLGPLEGEAKWALLAGADVLLVPSVKESFGMSAAEALAIGTPVICTDGVGAGSIISRIDPGAVVPRTRQALAASLHALLADEPRRRAFGTWAARIMSTEFGWRAIAQRMAEVYQESAATSAARRRAAA